MKEETKKLFEKFKASHKELTAFDDLLLVDGIENIISGYSLGDLKALHVYDNNVHMEEVFTVREEQDGPCEPFCCTIGNETKCAETREELEPMLFEWWRWECQDGARGSYEHMCKHPEKYGRQDLLDLLQNNDPNGEYQDKYHEGDDCDPFLTWEDAVHYVRITLQ